MFCYTSTDSRAARRVPHADDIFRIFMSGQAQLAPCELVAGVHARSARTQTASFGCIDGDAVNPFWNPPVRWVEVILARTRNGSDACKHNWTDNSRVTFALRVKQASRAAASMVSGSRR